PFVGDLPVLNWFTYSFTLNNPRTFSGTLYNYPDDGRQHTDLLTLLYSSTHPAQGLFSRRMEYSFDEIQFYATLYIGGSLGRFTGYLGFNFGQAMYNFDLLENNVRVSHAVNHYRPFSSQSVILGYRLGRPGAAWLPGNTLVYLEVITENTGLHPVHTDLIRTGGGPPDPLYANTTYIRIGIRKTLQLVDDTQAQEPQEKIREIKI
ncbi:MAG: hypothetical protein HY042_13220, partial [Spirochaetia bacterium]|nr:hypothetical protein [Spirochaetia bacterium]